MKLAPRQEVVINLPPTSRSPKPLNEDAGVQAARSAAVARTKAIEAHAKNVRFTSWDDVEMRFHVSIPLSFKSQPCTYLNILNFCSDFVKRAVAEFSKEKQQDFSVATANGIVTEVSDGPVRIPTSEELGEVRVGTRTLKPRQKKCLFKIKHALFKQRTSCAVMCPLGTGTGKTIIAAAVISDMLANNLYGLGNGLGMWDIICIVPKATKIKFSRELAKCGLGNHLEQEIMVRTYNELNSAVMKNTFREKKRMNAYNGEEETYFEFALGKPALVIFDESHRLKRKETKAARRCLGFVNPATRFLFMSATPAIVADDLRLFGLASQLKWGGARVDEISWANFAREVGQGSVNQLRRGETTVANIFKYYDRVASAIINPPADPRKVKSFNGVKLIEFASEESRIRYENAQDKWLELCEKNGKTPDEWAQRLVAFSNFRQASEREAAGIVVDLALKELANGRAPVIMCSYKETIKIMLAEFSRRGQTRSNISVIWGGEPKITAENCYPIMEWFKLLAECDKPGFVWESPAAKAKYNRSTKYWNTAMKTERTVAEQAEQDRWLKDMRLFSQSDEQIQDEIDNFQEGRTQICLGTLSKAGTGLDLDHQIETVRPRTMLAFPCYYAEEFIQAYGRIYREYTLSDAYQWVILFAGTIVTEHVAPILAKKLASITASTGMDLNLEAKLTDAAAKSKLIIRGEKITEVVAETSEVIIEEDDDDEDEE